MVFIGCIFAFILRKLSVDEKLPEVEMAKNENWIKSNLPVQDKKATGSKVMIPLTQSYVQKVHHNRLKEIRMTNLSVEIVVYFFYIFLALLIAYGHRSPNAYIMGANINNMMVKNKFDKVDLSLNVFMCYNSMIIFLHFHIFEGLSKLRLLRLQDSFHHLSFIVPYLVLNMKINISVVLLRTTDN